MYVPDTQTLQAFWTVDVRLPGKGNSNSHGARPVHQIISMIKWMQNSKLSIKNSLSAGLGISLVAVVYS